MSDVEDKKRLSPDLETKLSVLPDRPGVYLFKDEKGRVIYVGKAKSLRQRVRSYFTARDDGRYQFPRLVSSIWDLDVILTRDEVEALKTEAALIRKYQPKYNVELKDDKTFPFLKVTREPFPRVLLTRKPYQSPPGDIYGPYTDVKATRFLLRTLKGILQIRDCSLPLTPERIARGSFKVCLDYHIGRCGGPCEGKVTQEEYEEGVKRFLEFLRGRSEEVIESLQREMDRQAAEWRFEEAAKTRDRLWAAQKFGERQPKVTPDPIDVDLIGIAREDTYAAISVLRVRNGRIVGKSPFHLERTGEVSTPQLLEEFISRHYTYTDHIPDEICLPDEVPDREFLEEFLLQSGGHKVTLSRPQRGDKRKLMETAQANAEHLLAERRLMAEKRDFIPRSLKALQEALHLPHPPLHLEAFDISHTMGTDPVGALVVFKQGKPFKSAYRLYKIKSFSGVDDFAAIGEVVERRFKRLKEEMEQGENNKELRDTDQALRENSIPDEGKIDPNEDRGEFPSLPDLVVIDGGIGQLNRAKEVLELLGMGSIPVIGLAKRLEEIYLPGDPIPLNLPKTSSALKLLQQIRDEAHRFAISRHRLLRGKRQVKSRLDDIEGIGPRRRQQLLRHFGSLTRIAEATVEEIAQIPGFNLRLAEKVKEALVSPR